MHYQYFCEKKCIRSKSSSRFYSLPWIARTLFELLCFFFLISKLPNLMNIWLSKNHNKIPTKKRSGNLKCYSWRKDVLLLFIDLMNNISESRTLWLAHFCELIVSKAKWKTVQEKNILSLHSKDFPTKLELNMEKNPNLNTKRYC